MQFVCDTGYDATKWYFEAGKYMRLGNGAHKVSRISGQYLPDPFALWERKAATAGVAPNSPIGMRLRPHECTFKLWEHWQGVKHAYDHH
jgi:hypothetical protein